MQGGSSSLVLWGDPADLGSFGVEELPGVGGGWCGVEEIHGVRCRVVWGGGWGGVEIHGVGVGWWGVE